LNPTLSNIDKDLKFITNTFIKSQSYNLVSRFWHIHCIEIYENLIKFGFKKCVFTFLTKYYILIDFFLYDYWFDGAMNNLKEMNSNLPPLVEFILPGGDDFSSRVHIARTVCRRVERKIVELLEVENRTERWIQYLNRLSDFLFVLARFYTYKHEVDESQWDRSK